MREGRTAACVVVAALCVFSPACKKSKIDTNDSTPPTVTILVKGADGQYKETDQASLKADGSESLNFMCTVEDPEGVKFVGYTYNGGATSCTVNGAIFNGSFQIQPLPAPASQTLSGDPNAQVLTKLPLISNPDLKGPFTCSVPGNGTGVPYGDKIKIECTGRNWSSNSQVNEARKTLTVSLH